MKLRIPATGFSTIDIRPSISHDHVWTVLLIAGRALVAVRLQARRVLCTDAYAVARFEVFLHGLADAEDFPDDLMADANGCAEFKICDI